MDEEALKQQQEAEAKAKADAEAKRKTSGSTATDDDDDDNTDDDAGDDDAKGKTVSAKAFYTVKQQLKDYKTKLREIERKEQERRDAELPELDRLKKENQSYQERLQRLESEQAKLDAYSRLKKKVLGDNYILENEDKVLAQVKKLSYNEDDVDDDITDLLEIAKRPKKGGSQTLNLGAANKGAADKKPEEYTPKELKELEKSDPDKFKDVLEQRKAARR